MKKKSVLILTVLMLAIIGTGVFMFLQKQSSEESSTTNEQKKDNDNNTQTEPVIENDSNDKKEQEFSQWFFRGDTPVTLTVTDYIAKTGDYSLMISDRLQDWNGAGTEYEAEPGKTYSLSVWVYQNSGSPQTLLLSAAVTMDGIEGYQNIHRKECASGEWTQLKGNYTAGEKAEKTVFYVETSNAPTLVFFIDDFYVEEGEKEELPTGLPILKDTYKEEFMIGAAVPRTTFTNHDLTELLAQQYNIFTPENELKPANVLDKNACIERAQNNDETHPAISLIQCKPLLDFAKEKNLKVHGHVLLWYQQTPDWFFRVGYDENGELASRDVMLARMENYIKAVMEETTKEYPGLIISWDVVNEAIFDATAALRPTKEEDAQNGCRWADTVGDDYVEKAFFFARKYAPEGTLLFYNDYSIPSGPKRDAIKNLILPMIKANTIDGIGFQGHYELGNPSNRQLTDALKVFCDLSLKIRISELDIKIPNNKEEMLLKQAERYQNLFNIFKEFKEDIIAVTFWGVNDGTSWIADQYPLLFDASMQPKYAFYGLTDPSKLPQSLRIMNSFGPVKDSEDSWSLATKYQFGEYKVSSIYDEENIYFAIYSNTLEAKELASGNLVFEGKNYEISEDSWKETSDGSVLKIKIPQTVRELQMFKFNITLKDKDKSISFTSLEEAKLSIRKMPKNAVAVYGKPDITLDTIDMKEWEKASYYDVDQTVDFDATEGGRVAVRFKTLWSEENLYVLADVTDYYLDASKANTYEQDSIEVFIDEGNDKKTDYESGDGQYRINFNDLLSIDQGEVSPNHKVIKTETGFIAQMEIPFVKEVAVGDLLGFDVRYNNASKSGVRKRLNFYDTTDTGWQDTKKFGVLVLK